MAGGVFISYRRGDAAGWAGRLHDYLHKELSPTGIFIDVHDIEPGLDFAEIIDRRLADCEVLIVVIGKAWLDIRDESNARRLDDPSDLVRLEIETALGRGIRVIPTLVDDAPTPRAQDLPDSLKTLARRNAFKISHEGFASDAGRLVQALRKIEEERRRRQSLASDVITPGENVAMQHSSSNLRVGDEGDLLPGGREPVWTGEKSIRPFLFTSKKRFLVAVSLGATAILAVSIAPLYWRPLPAQRIFSPLADKAAQLDITPDAANSINAASNASATRPSKTIDGPQKETSVCPDEPQSCISVSTRFETRNSGDQVAYDAFQNSCEGTVKFTVYECPLYGKCQNKSVTLSKGKIYSAPFYYKFSGSNLNPKDYSCAP